MNQSQYTLSRTDFGNSNGYKYYVILLKILESSICFLFLVSFNILVIIKFKKYIHKRQSLLGIYQSEYLQTIRYQSPATECLQSSNINQNNAGSISVGPIGDYQTNNLNQRAEKNFTLMVIISTFFFIVCRLVEVLAGITTIFEEIKKENKSNFTRIFLITAHLNTYFIYSCNFATYIFFNKNFRKIFLIKSREKLRILRSWINLG